MTWRPIFDTLELMALTYFVFAVAGMNLFAGMPFRKYINDTSNFDNIIMSMVTLFRCSTGENWNRIMREAMMEEPFCQGQFCNQQTTAVAFFVVFMIIQYFTLANVLVGQIVKQFESDFDKKQTTQDNVLGLTTVQRFGLEWQRYTDEHWVPADKVELIAEGLLPELGFPELSFFEKESFYKAVYVPRRGLVHYINLYYMIFRWVFLWAKPWSQLEIDNLPPDQERVMHLRKWALGSHPTLGEYQELNDIFMIKKGYVVAKPKDWKLRFPAAKQRLADLGHEDTSEEEESEEEEEISVFDHHSDSSDEVEVHDLTDDEEPGDDEDLDDLDGGDEETNFVEKRRYHFKDLTVKEDVAIEMQPLSSKIDVRKL